MRSSEQQRNLVDELIARDEATVERASADGWREIMRRFGLPSAELSNEELEARLEQDREEQDTYRRSWPREGTDGVTREADRWRRVHAGFDAYEVFWPLAEIIAEIDHKSLRKAVIDAIASRNARTAAEGGPPALSAGDADALADQLVSLVALNLRDRISETNRDDEAAIVATLAWFPRVRALLIPDLESDDAWGRTFDLWAAAFALLKRIIQSQVVEARVERCDVALERLASVVSSEDVRLRELGAAVQEIVERRAANLPLPNAARQKLHRARRAARKKKSS
jgi:hypothetical protein